MENSARYTRCSAVEKDALDRLYVYLGFNEIVSMQEYLDFMFKNAKENIAFPHILNHTLKHIVTSFWNDYPEYRGNYISIFWVNPEDVKVCTETGCKNEYDPKGLIRHYVKNNFKKLYATKQ